METTGGHTECTRCGRPLSSPASRARGTGRWCLARAREEAVRLADEYTAGQISEALDLITDGGLVRVRTRRVWLAVSSDGEDFYRAASTGQCNCPAGLHARRCYHGAAARMLATTRQAPVRQFTRNDYSKAA